MQNYEVTKCDEIVSHHDPQDEIECAANSFLRDRFLWDPNGAVEFINRSRGCLRSLQSLAEMRLKQESLYITGTSTLTYSGQRMPLHELYNQRKDLVAQFTDDVNEEIIKPIDNFFSLHRTMVHDLERDRQKLSGCMDSLLSQVKKSLGAIQRSDASIKSLVLKNEPSKFVSLCKLYTQYKSEIDNHEQLQQSLNTFVEESYKPSMSTILNMYQDMVNSAQALLDDCTRKMIVFEVSLNRGFQYDLDKFTTADIPFSPSLQPSSPPSMSPISSLPILNDDIKDLITNSFCTISADTDLYTKIKPRLCSSSEFDANEIESIRHELNDRFSHISFLQSVEADVSSITTITGIQNLGRLLWVLLDDCEPLSVCRICWLAKKVYCTDNKGVKKFLQSEIYDHPLWNRIKVWEEMLTVTIAETVCSTSSSRITIDDFGTYILMFGWSFDSALKLVERVIGDSFSWYSGKGELLDRLIMGLNEAAERQLRTTRVGQKP